MLIDDLRLVTTLLVRLRNYYPNEITNNEDAACDRMARTVAAYDALAPDWSTAPEWATRCTIDWKGARRWTGGNRSWASEWVDLPIGLDWRLCIWQRPPAQEPQP